MPVARQGLPQREQMFRPVVSFQCLHNLFLTGTHPAIAQLCQLVPIPLPSQNRLYYGEPAGPGDIAQHPMDLHVHLVQRFLPVLDRLARRLHQPAAVP